MAYYIYPNKYPTNLQKPPETYKMFLKVIANIMNMSITLKPNRQTNHFTTIGCLA